jgi:hypothetical protein
MQVCAGHLHIPGSAFQEKVHIVNITVFRGQVYTGKKFMWSQYGKVFRMHPYQLQTQVQCILLKIKIATAIPGPGLNTGPDTLFHFIFGDFLFGLI